MNAKYNHITIRKFTPMFEKICNFIAVSKTGDHHETIKGLIKLCLFEFPKEKFTESTKFYNYINELFGLEISQNLIDSALEDLENEKIIYKHRDLYYILDSQQRKLLNESIEEAQSLENCVKESWFNELSKHYPHLPKVKMWRILKTYLRRTFRRHGLQAVALLNPSVESPPEHELSLSSILKKSIHENDLFDDLLYYDAKDAISKFMSGIGSNPERSSYIIQLADGAFNFYTLEVPTDLSTRLKKDLSDLTIFLDTNFLFGILDLHNSTQVQISHELLRAINFHKLPFKLRYHEETYKEMKNTISHYGNILRSSHWTQSLSKAVLKSGNLSGILMKFHELNSKSIIDVDEFLRPYEHFDHLLKEENIHIYRSHEKRFEEQNDLYHEYMSFLMEQKKESKPYNIVMHDAKLLDQTRFLRTKEPSTLKAGALIISCDYYFYRFDRKFSQKEGIRPCVLLPNIFWQILRPFIPSDQDFEKAFAETFALPEFIAIGSGGNKACMKMINILSTYKEIPEETAIKMLANDLMLEQLSDEKNDEKFAKIVESAFVEENRILIEEKAALKTELDRLMKKSKDLSKKRKDENIKFEEQHNELSNTIENIQKEIQTLTTALNEHQNDLEKESERAKDAEEQLNIIKKEFDDQIYKKSKLVKQNTLMRILNIISYSIIIILLYLFIVFKVIHWNWMITHENVVPIQLCISSTIILFIIGLFVGSCRKWCWGVGVFSLFILFLTII